MDPVSSKESESRFSAYVEGLVGVIGHADPQALGHGKNQRSIAHIEPKRSANEFSVGVPRERIIRFGAEIGIVEITHDIEPSSQPPFKAFLPSSREPVP